MNDDGYDFSGSDLAPVVAGLDALRLLKSGVPVDRIYKTARPATREFLGWSQPMAKAAPIPQSVDTNTLHGMAAIAKRRVARAADWGNLDRETRTLSKAMPKKRPSPRARARRLYAKARNDLNAMVGTRPALEVAEAQARLAIIGSNLARAGLLPA